jgi:hypothetical protein
VVQGVGVNAFESCDVCDAGSRGCDRVVRGVGGMCV